MTALGSTLRPLKGPFDAEFVGSLESALRDAGRAPLSGDLCAALASVAAVSPFLKHLMLADAPTVVDVLRAPLAENVAAACDFSGDARKALRRGKRRLALTVALADLVGGASVQTVTHALSDFADAAIGHALAVVLADARARSHMTVEDPGASGIVVLAMGKLGGRELNFSSDIDLVVLFDPARAGTIGLSAGRIVRMTQRLAGLLNTRTADGYVFRVDLRLRPDPGSTTVAVSTQAAMHYYRSRARAWERQAMIKARQVAGDPIAGTRYLEALGPSIWPTLYDFNAIDETMAMREQIAAVKGAGTMTLPGHNIKIGRGGIREIEFFVQSLQRVAGGRDKRLRGRETVPMLHALADAGWVRDDDAAVMSEAYVYLRRVEHRLQMVGDEQLHTLPDAAGLPRLARMMDDPSFEANLRDKLIAVNLRFVGLGNGVLRQGPRLDVELGAGGTVDADAAAAFEDRAAKWREGPYASLRSARARALLERLEPDLCRAVAGSPNREEALDGLDTFLARLLRGIDFFARLDRQRDLIAVFMLIITAAPRLAEQLAQREHLLDALVDPEFYGTSTDIDALAASLDDALAMAGDYESKLDALRIFGQEHLLLSEVRILVGSVRSATAGGDIARLAALLTSRALNIAADGFAAQHGHILGSSVALLALGSFGSFEMTPASDLDLVFIYDTAEDGAQSDGARPLSAGPYFTRLARRFIAALSAPTTRGMLYEVDLRLRPSGRAGPLATQITSFERYHDESAWVWEQMALTRARVVAGDPALAARATAAIAKTLTRTRDPQALADEVLAMRRKLEGVSPHNAKHAPGGLLDIEFIAQFLRLRTGLDTTTTNTRQLLRELAAIGALDGGSLETLVDAHRLFRRLMLLFATSGVEAEPAEAPAALKPLLLRVAEAPDMAFLTADLTERRAAVRALFQTLIGTV